MRVMIPAARPNVVGVMRNIICCSIGPTAKEVNENNDGGITRVTDGIGFPEDRYGDGDGTACNEEEIRKGISQRKARINRHLENPATSRKE